MLVNPNNKSLPHNPSSSELNPAAALPSTTIKTKNSTEGILESSSNSELVIILPGKEIPPVSIAQMEEVAEINHQMIESIKQKMPSHIENFAWLKTQKNWAQIQLQKLQKFHESLINKKEAAIANLKIKTVSQEYFELIDTLNAQIKETTPFNRLTLTFEPHQESFFHKITKFLSKCVDSFLSKIQTKAAIFEKINNLRGEHEELTSDERHLLEQLFKNKKFANQIQDLIGEQSLESYVDKILDELTELRKIQLQFIKEGKPALLFHHEIARKVIEKPAFLKTCLAFLRTSSNSPEEQLEKDIEILKTIFTSAIEGALSSNEQVLTDCIYPDCVLYTSDEKKQLDGIPWTSVERSLGQYKNADADGYISRESSHLKQKSEWQNVETREDRIFVKGYYSISLKSPHGDKVESGAELDLTNLGDLSREQVRRIFSFTASLIQGNFRNKYGKFDESVFLGKAKEYGLDQVLTEDQLALSIAIIVTFADEITTALTLGLMTAGHESTDH